MLLRSSLSSLSIFITSVSNSESDTLLTFISLSSFSGVFAGRSYRDLSSCQWNLLAGGPGMGLELLIPKISLANFYPTQVGVGPAHSVSLRLLSVWMDVVSLIPQLSDLEASCVYLCCHPDWQFCTFFSSPLFFFQITNHCSFKKT